MAALLPDEPPERPADMETVFADFERIVPGAMTHWQHPRFFAYFPANAAPASMLAQQLANAIAAQCMLWQTSPAATEIEEVMIRWLRDALGLAPRLTRPDFEQLPRDLLAASGAAIGALVDAGAPPTGGRRPFTPEGE